MSVFLNSSNNVTVKTLAEGSLTINGNSLSGQNLVANYPVKSDSNRKLYSSLIQPSDIAGGVLTNPFAGTLEVINLLTAYNTTPVDLNQFIASTVNDVTDLESNTQYITSSLGRTEISSNILTNDIKCNSVGNQASSTYIDFTSATDINVNATTFEFNGNPILSNPLATDLDIDDNYIQKCYGLELSDNISVIPTPPTGTITLYNEAENVYTIDSSDIVRQLAYGDSMIVGPTASVIGHITSWNDTNGLVLADSGIVGANVVTSLAIGTTGDIPVYTGARGIQDSGVLLSSLITGATASAIYVPYTGATTNININSREITNLSAIRFPLVSSNVIIGNAAGASSTQNVVVGNSAVTGISSLGSTIIGDTSSATDSGCVAVGIGAAALQIGAIAVGSASSSNGVNAVSLGRLAVSSATQAHTIGYNLTNSTANSLLVDATANIRPSTNAVCDLGTSGIKFKDEYLSGTLNTGLVVSSDATDSTTTTTGAIKTAGGIGVVKAVFAGGKITTTDVTDSTTVSTGSIISSGGIGLAKAIFAGGKITTSDATDSTTVSTGSIISSGGIGCAKAITAGTTVTGTRFIASTPCCYSTYVTAIGAGVAYTANTAKLVDISTSTELIDPTNEFTTTAGTSKVTYTGSATGIFLVNIIFNVYGSVTPSALTHWVSKNGSLTLVAARAYNFTATTPVGYLPFEVSNIYSLATNDTVQLAGQYTATANVNIYDCQYQVIRIG